MLNFFAVILNGRIIFFSRKFSNCRRWMEREPRDARAYIRWIGKVL